MINSMEALLGAGAVKTSVVKVCGHDLRIRELTVMAKRRVGELAAVDAAKCTHFIVQHCVIDENGQPLLPADQAETVEALSGAFVEAVAAEVFKLSGLTDDTAKKD